ncbi:MAG: ATP-binding protein [SAR324 cluster bacterium]|nr:ATP-binding protein [SAR324 cluster bacterium]
MHLDISDQFIDSFSIAIHLPNTLSVLENSAEAIVSVCREQGGYTELQLNHLQMGLIEMLINASEHGNLEIDGDLKEKMLEEDTYWEFFEDRSKQTPYESRIIQVELKFSRREIRVCITDEGPGFKPQLVKQDLVSNALAISRRGIVLTKKQFVNELIYNEKGNQVTLVVHAEAKAANQ